MNQQTLLREAAEWRLIGLLLECPKPGWREQLAALSAETGDATLREAGQAALEEASEGLYHSVFGPGGPAPPREVSYHDSVQLGYLVSELASYYDAFGFRADSPETPDHVGVEAGFVGYLRLKEAYALACEDADRAAVTAEAAQRFLDDHLSTMAARLAATLEQSGISYLALATKALLERTGPPRNTRPDSAMAVLSAQAGGFVPEESLFDCGDQQP